MKLPGTRSKSRKKELFLRLETVWTRPENQQCVDCGQQNTSYASILGPVLGASKKQKLGVFCCHKCCNYHMTLGRGVCLVKNLKTADDMKDWTEDEIRVLEASGNEVTNGIYEKNLRKKRPSPSDYDAMQQFVQNKYHPEKLRFICQETYEAHHGFWSAKYKETVNQMTEIYNEMAIATELTTTTTSKNHSSGGGGGTSPSNNNIAGPQSYGPKLQPESGGAGAAVKNSSPLTGGSTAPTECESSLSETGIPTWEPSWEPEAAEKNVTDISSNNHSNSEDDDNKDQETDMEEDPSSRAEKPDEMSISSQVTARLAGRRASSAISGRRISDQSRRERRTSAALNPSDHFNQSMSSVRLDPYNQSTSHSRSPAPSGDRRPSHNRASRRLSNESADHRDSMPPEIAQSSHSKSPGASRRTSLMNRQHMSTRRLSSESENRRASMKSRSASMRFAQANNEAAGGDAIASQSQRPGMSPRNRGMSRRSLSTDGSSLHGSKELRQVRGQRRKPLGRSKSYDMEGNDTDDDDDDRGDNGAAAAEKPRPSPRRAMSRRSLSTDGSDLKGSTSLHAQKELRRMRSQRRNSINNCSDPELDEDGGGGEAAAENPRPRRSNKSLPRRSKSTDGSVDVKGGSSSSSLHGSKELRQIRSQRRISSLSKSLNKSRNFDMDFNNNDGDSDPELLENDGAGEKPRPSPRKSKSRRSISTDGSIDVKGSSSLHGSSRELRKSRSRKGSLHRSKSFDVDFNGNSDAEDNADESAEFQPSNQQQQQRRKTKSRRSKDEDGVEVKAKGRSSQRRSSLSKSKSSDTEDDGVVDRVKEKRSSRQRRSSLSKSRSSDTEILDDGNGNDSDCNSCDDEEENAGDHSQSSYNETPTGNRKANIRLAVTMLAEMNNKTDGKDLVDNLFKDGDGGTTTKKKSKADLRREASVILNKREEVSLLLGN